MECVEIGPCTLIYADCLSILPLLKGDLLLADPPYGMGYKSNHNSGRRGEWAKYVRGEDFKPINGDAEPFDPIPWFMYPKVVLWGANYYSESLEQNNNWLVWDKRDGSTSDKQADCELAWTNLPGPPRLFSHKWRGIIRAGEENISRQPKLHPNQKPVALMDWVIEQCKPTGDETIIDPYMGSASMGVAALRRGMRYIGVDNDINHFHTACARIFDEYCKGVA